MEVMVLGGGYGEIWSEWFAILIANTFVRGYYFQYTNFLGLSENELMIAIAVIPVNVSGKQGEIKAPVLTRLSHSLDP